MKSFLKNLFGSSSTSEKDIIEPNLVFGRYTDFYKPKAKYEEWDKALEAHGKKNYFTSILHFLSYITDELNENIEIDKQSDDKIKFKIYQGSKCIEGFANQDGFFAEAKIAKCEVLSVGALRILLEENYHLRYSSYALDSDNNLTIVLYTDYIDASPYKLYYGLKEIATRSDRRDDVMVSKFQDLSQIENGLISPISEQEKEIKFAYFSKLLNDCLKKINEDDIRLKDYPVLASYCILSTCLMIDYFLKPEGLLMEHIENVHKIFYHITTLTPEQKNIEMVKELKAMAKLSKESIFKELYNTKSTFGILSPGNHLRLQEMVEQDLKHFDWYINNGYEDYAAYIPQYISGLLLYTYAMPLPDKNFLHLLLRVWHNSFFVDLGYRTFYKGENLDKSYITDSIKEAAIDLQDIYEEVVVDISGIEFTDVYSFSKTYLYKLHSLNIKKK